MLFLNIQRSSGYCVLYHTLMMGPYSFRLLACVESKKSWDCPLMPVATSVTRR